MHFRWTAVAALIWASGCAPSESDSPKRFVLPGGDPESGKQAFVDLKCYSCHEAEGIDDLPGPTADPRTDVVLGGLAMREPTDGELVTSIINPSHALIPGREEMRITTETGESRMANYQEVMTVQQLVDLVAFLHSAYRTREEYR